MQETYDADDEVVRHEIDPVEDETERDDTVIPVSYQITSYGADYDVDGLVKRLRNGDIFVPPFQRSYVWKQPEASRFIESLLLGLPVPGIFLAREDDTNKFLVLDGQQRLKSLQFFYDGHFNPKPDDTTTRKFNLLKVQPGFEGKTYRTLEERERRRLDNSIIHATIVRQESPSNEDSSIYHIFERLNSRGRLLTAQEIRCSIYHGPFIDRIKTLNEHQSWREIFGKKNTRLKDEELIIRFLSLYKNSSVYTRPMAEFLNGFVRSHRRASAEFLDECQSLFTSTIDLVRVAIGPKAFRPERALNAAVFDSVMVGLARRLCKEKRVEPSDVASAYSKLLADPKYHQTTSRSTADENYVSDRLALAEAIFCSI